MKVSVVLIGEDAPLYAMLEHSRSLKNINVVGIVSSEKRLNRTKKLLASYPKCNSISCPIFTYDEIEKLPNSFDYLINAFSIVILKKSILDRVKKKSLNIHPGLLPDYAGLHVHQWAIRHRQSFTGCTIHEIKEEIDSGEIYKIEKISINNNDTGLSLYTKLSKLASKMVVNLLTNLATNSSNLTLVIQDFSRRKLFTHNMACESEFSYEFSYKEFDAFFRACDYRPFKSPTYRCLIQLKNTALKIEPFKYSKLEVNKKEEFKTISNNAKAALNGERLFIPLKESILALDSYRIVNLDN